MLISSAYSMEKPKEMTGADLRVVQI